MLPFLFLALLAGLSEATQCGVSNSLASQSRAASIFGGRIVGGSEVRDCSVIPWQVRLSILGNLCGGSIISDRHILTASHCLEKVTHPGQVKVHIADHHLYSQGRYEFTADVKTVTMHPQYNSYTYQSDIAVLTLAYPISFSNPCVKPICLDPSFTYDGMHCTVSGWGTLYSGGPIPSKLNMVQVKTHHGTNCNRAFDIFDSRYVYDTQRMICAGFKHGGKDSCQGDSGGPLVCYNSRSRTFVQVGVVSFGQGCALANIPGVYASTAYFHNWINQVMRST